MPDICIGLMSGTSLDGVDGVAADFSGPRLRVLGHAALPFPAALRAELLALNTTGPDELHRAALAGNALARLYAEVVAQLLRGGALAPSAVRAVGAHGQTVRHRPQEFDGTGYTLQLNQPALLAELTGIAVVADFRSRDVAAGGQGAPLVPAFHQGVFARAGQATLVLNIGGIANLSVLHADGSATGFDTGPGNALMDHWCQRHTGRNYDADGAWAAQGRVVEPLLARLLAEPFLARTPPKSTGRDLFNPAWLAAHLSHGDAAPVDVQATLTEFTARTISDAMAAAIARHGAEADTAIVCGGGAFNGHLMRRLQALAPAGMRIASSGDFGLPPLQVEAAAFAWLARQALQGLPGNLPAATGARGPRILGAIYPAPTAQRS
ncbi:anhydro-N-acetylmuramic acid kinase [Ramlibacter sp. H39-3-26]|uniref:anhydro-N-acetylmuramic acid kinase n=1 Tax=Curvibacter soli TaxID=3031331 RepID=UPI0023DBE7B0|nr:anhydro-N-acetylmuramic acid kinase [Ramlibacter sp. H39-3-26]MDF1486458.1 anhydro-N-acetylmuramic acid kinase [Ramlibacter sp. H39-3-26]